MVVKGFTLLELVMVLTIMLISSFIVAPRVLVFIDDMKVESGARQVAADLRYTQQLAISKQKYYKFEIKIGNRDYYILEQISAAPGWQQVKYSKLDEEIKFQSATLPAPGFIDTSGSNVAIDFDSFGAPMPSSGGSITIQDQNSGLTHNVLIANVTGKVDIQ